MATDETYDDLDPDPEAFRDLGYRTVDMMAEHFAGVRDVDTVPDATPEELAATFDDPLPMEGADPDDVLDEWDDRVYPNAVHPGSPRWYGYVLGSGTPIGALADALAGAINNNVGGWFGGPSATEVERQCLRWLAEAVGYPTDGGGVLTSGGSMANHAAVFTALQDATGFHAGEEGLRGLDDVGDLLVYHSAHEGHSSIDRVAEMVGIGASGIREVPCTDDYRLDPAALDAMVRDDLAAGHTPVCVVGYVGSINVSAIDPLERIADVCDDHGVWLHADGACGAVGAMVPEWRDRYAGLDRADSVTLDPHKWLGVPYGCGCVLFRDAETQARAFASVDAAYLDQTEEAVYHGTNFGYLGPELSRPFRALKLWMSLKHRGIEGYRRLLRQSCGCAEHLHELVVEADDLDRLQEPNLFIYSFRYRPPDLEEAAGRSSTAVDRYLDRLNQWVADDLRLTGDAYLTTTEVADRTVLRMSICSHRTTPDDIDATVDAIRRHGERIDAGRRSGFDLG